MEVFEESIRPITPEIKEETERQKQIKLNK